MGLILASSSAIRRAMLDAAGVDCRAVPADIDEGIIKSQRPAGDKVARTLADAKALAVSTTYPDEWIIGSDSVVSVAGRLFDKPSSREEAADHLRFFADKPMTLTSAVSLARDGEVDWSEVDSATMFVRALSDSFIESYLDAEWPAVSYCVGVFRLEGPGVQLFDRIDGNYFTVLGMPLLPLLSALRRRELLPS
jgi:septum formation protein